MGACNNTGDVGTGQMRSTWPQDCCALAPHGLARQNSSILQEQLREAQHCRGTQVRQHRQLHSRCKSQEDPSMTIATLEKGRAYLLDNHHLRQVHCQHNSSRQGGAAGKTAVHGRDDVGMVADQLQPSAAAGPTPQKMLAPMLQQSVQVRQWVPPRPHSVTAGA